jgi:hypothetical protein
MTGPFPTAARGEALLVSPDFSFGGRLHYIYSPNEFNEEDEEPREVTRACLNVADGSRFQMSESGFITLRADFKVKRVTRVNVECRDDSD